jgi:hypothetical protein
MFKKLNIKSIFTYTFIIIGVFALFNRLYTALLSSTNGVHMTTTSIQPDNWNVYTSTIDHFEASFPSKVQQVNSEDDSSLQYVSKDSNGSLYAIQPFVPEKELIAGKSSKEILQIALKTLVMKPDVKVIDTTYSEYQGEIVSVDFDGRMSGLTFKGKMILEGSTIYYLYFISKSSDGAINGNYEKFIKSFRLI